LRGGNHKGLGLGIFVFSSRRIWKQFAEKGFDILETPLEDAEKISNNFYIFSKKDWTG